MFFKRTVSKTLSKDIKKILDVVCNVEDFFRCILKIMLTIEHPICKIAFSKLSFCSRGNFAI